MKKAIDVMLQTLGCIKRHTIRPIKDSKVLPKEPFAPRVSKVDSFCALPPYAGTERK